MIQVEPRRFQHVEAFVLLSRHPISRHEDPELPSALYCQCSVQAKNLHLLDQTSKQYFSIVELNKDWFFKLTLFPITINASTPTRRNPPIT
jgi:hypothetical protein